MQQAGRNVAAPAFISLLNSMNKDLRTQEKEIVIQQGPGYSGIDANTIVYSADPMNFLYGNYNQNMFVYGNGIHVHPGNVGIMDNENEISINTPVYGR